MMKKEERKSSGKEGGERRKGDEDNKEVLMFCLQSVGMWVHASINKYRRVGALTNTHKHKYMGTAAAKTFIQGARFLLWSNHSRYIQGTALLQLSLSVFH